MFIPVLDKPLSSNQYYAIKFHGKHKGQAFTCSKEEDKQTCCFCRCIRDVKPKPFDPQRHISSLRFVYMIQVATRKVTLLPSLLHLMVFHRTFLGEKVGIFVPKLLKITN